MTSEFLKGCKDHLEVLLADLEPQRVVDAVRAYKKALYIKYFKGYRVYASGRARIKEMLRKEIIESEEPDEKLAQLIVLLWNRANADLYRDIYHKVESINEEVDLVAQIGDEKTREFLQDLLQKYDKKRIWMCTVLNEVRFTPSIVEEMLGIPLPEVNIKRWESGKSPRELEEEENKEETEKEEKSTSKEEEKASETASESSKAETDKPEE